MEENRAFARAEALRCSHLWAMPAEVRKYLETGDPSLREKAFSLADAIAYAPYRWRKMCSAEANAIYRGDATNELFYHREAIKIAETYGSWIKKPWDEMKHIALAAESACLAASEEDLSLAVVLTVAEALGENVDAAKRRFADKGGK